MRVPLSFENDGIGAAVAIGKLENGSDIQKLTSKVIAKFVRWNGSHGTITVEFDAVAGTAAVIPVEQEG